MPDPLDYKRAKATYAQVRKDTNYKLTPDANRREAARRLGVDDETFARVMQTKATTRPSPSALTAKPITMPPAAPVIRAASSRPMSFRQVGSDWGDRWYAQKPLSKDQASSVSSYSTSTYEKINRWLRTGSPLRGGGSASDKVMAQVKKSVSNIDDAMRPIPDSIMVRRGVDLNAFGADELTDFTTLVGKSFTDRGFLSTTTKDVGFKRRVQMEVKVPEGTPGVWVDPVRRHEVQRENELLLGRDLKYVVESVERLNPKFKFEAKWKVVVRIVP